MAKKKKKTVDESTPPVTRGPAASGGSTWVSRHRARDRRLARVARNQQQAREAIEASRRALG